MALTPDEIVNFPLKQAVRGYSVKQVDELLDQLADQIERHQRDLDEIRQRMADVAAAPPGSPESESALSRALLTAQRAADETLQNARREATELRETAQRDAESTISTARSEADALLATARAESESLRSEARTEADSLREDARSQAEAVRAEAHAEADTVRDDARSEADSLRAEGRIAARALQERHRRVERALEERITALQAIEREFRGRLRGVLERHLSEVEEIESFPADILPPKVESEFDDDRDDERPATRAADSDDDGDDGPRPWGGPAAPAPVAPRVVAGRTPLTMRRSDTARDDVASDTSHDAGAQALHGESRGDVRAAFGGPRSDDVDDEDAAFLAALDATPDDGWSARDDRADAAEDLFAARRSPRRSDAEDDELRAAAASGTLTDADGANLIDVREANDRDATG